MIRNRRENTPRKLGTTLGTTQNVVPSAVGTTGDHLNKTHLTSQNGGDHLNRSWGPVGSVVAVYEIDRPRPTNFQDKENR
jgi:hypothetical protein